MMEKKMERTPENTTEKTPEKTEKTAERGPFYCFWLYVARIAGILFFDVRFFGAHRVPKSGSVVIAANHQSMLDPVLVGICFDRGCSFLARETLFRVPILGWLIRNLRSFPVPRESTAPKRALEVCVKLLEEGRALLLFPEGTRSYDGRLQPLKRGVALVARRSRAPVVPALIRGSYKSWPRTRAFPRPASVRIFFGEPIQFDPMESSDSFVDRLSASYRRLAIETGATEVLDEESSYIPLAAEGACAIHPHFCPPEGGAPAAQPNLFARWRPYQSRGLKGLSSHGNQSSR